VKLNTDYQERRGVLQGPAEDLPNGVETRIKNTVKRICRTLEIDGYARIDFRLSNEGVPYFIDANPNPEIAAKEEFAQSAEHDGLPYPDLLNRILALGLSRAGGGAEEA
jgi:D-alanine-D-alanine ligase